MECRFHPTNRVARHTELHQRIFTVSFAQVDLLFVIGTQYQRFGIAAGLMMLIIAVTSRLLIRRSYEIFYIMHVLLVVAILVTLYFHRPWIKTRTSVIVFICAGLFILDKLTRIIKYACFSRGTTATIVPLANGSTRITLNRSVPGTKAGSHAFLWLPRIQALQSHPCTMVSADPVSFILKARDGFTKDLNRHASTLTDMITPATIDSAYGVVPSFEKYDRVLLIAGGSGATWAIAVTMDLLSRGLPNMLELVWVIRDSGKSLPTKTSLLSFLILDVPCTANTQAASQKHCRGSSPSFELSTNPPTSTSASTVPATSPMTPTTRLPENEKAIIQRTPSDGHLRYRRRRAKRERPRKGLPPSCRARAGGPPHPSFLTTPPRPHPRPPQHPSHPLRRHPRHGQVRAHLRRRLRARLHARHDPQRRRRGECSPHRPHRRLTRRDLWLVRPIPTTADTHQLG